MSTRSQTGALEAARNGAGWAFEAIYTSLAGPVSRFAAAQGAPDPDATTQEVFLRVFRRLDRFDGDADHLRSWVFTVARNLLTDERRAAARRPLTAPGMKPEGASPHGEDDLVAVVEASSVRRILDELPDEQREIIVLRFLLDLPADEVATVVGRSVPAVKALQHRGLVRLRRNLEGFRPGTAPLPAPTTFTVV